MNNKKRFLIIVLVIILSMLSACSLVDKPDDDRDTPLPPLSFEDDYLVGFMIYITMYDSMGDYDYPTTDFKDEEAFCVYLKKEFEESIWGQSPYTMPVYQGGFDIELFKITNNGAAPNGAIEIEASFYYTSALYGQILNIKNIYATKDNDYYTKAGENYFLSSYSKISTAINQKLEASRTGNDGTKEEIAFEAKMTINIEAADYLLSARILEFDKNHNLINTAELDINISKDNVEFTCLEDCDYIIIERDFIDNENNQFYTQRKIIERKENIIFEDILIPLDNGFVKRKLIEIKFDNHLGEENEK